MGKDVTTVQYEQVVKQNRALQQELREHKAVINKIIGASGALLDSLQACVSCIADVNAVLQEYLKSDENANNANV